MKMETIDVTNLDVIEVTYKLRHTLGMSYQEIADFLQISLGTVESRLARGRKRHGRRPDWVRRSTATTRKTRNATQPLHA
jgi:transposase